MVRIMVSKRIAYDVCLKFYAKGDAGRLLERLHAGRHVVNQPSSNLKSGEGAIFTVFC